MDFIKNTLEKNQEKNKVKSKEINEVKSQEKQELKVDSVYGNIPKEVYNLLDEVLSYVYTLEKKQNMK